TIPLFVAMIYTYNMEKKNRCQASTPGGWQTVANRVANIMEQLFIILNHFMPKGIMIISWK
ncbi:MAG TPA: hypothetical protein ACFYEK_15800, partial [Candidatus Wunengus sp. YC60]|uniref:hypothetical protein n=1 Tax=Candidatus Wunengus sp. YC60 TaxID=3367697 RepID=UPI004028676D